MTTTQHIAKNTAVQLVGKIISTVLGLVAFALMAHTLGTEQFGWYVTASGFLQFIGILSDFGFTVTTAKMLAEPRFDKDQLFATLFTWRLITAGLFQGLAPLAILLFPYPAEIKLAVAITTVSFFAFAVNQVLIGYYQVHLRMHLQAIGEVLGRIVLVAGIALCTITRAGFLSMMVVVTLAAVVYSAYLIIHHGHLRWCLDRTISRAIFITMWPTALSVLCNSFYLQGDRVILPLFVSQTAVGLYGSSYRILDIITQITAMIMGLMLPLIAAAWSRDNREQFASYAQLSLDLTALLIFPIIGGILVLHTPLMVLVAGANFAAAGPLLQYLSISIAGVCLGMVFGHILLAASKQRLALAVFASDAVLSTIGYFVFIRLYGSWGAVGVTIFSEWYAGLLLAWLAIRATGHRPALATLGKITLASLVMAGALTLVPALPILVSILLGAVLYGLQVIALNVVPWSAIRTVLRSKKVAGTPLV